MARKNIRHSDASILMSALSEAIYKGKTSFTISGKHYQFNNLQHVKNTLNKKRKEEWSRVNGDANMPTRHNGHKGKENGSAP